MPDEPYILDGLTGERRPAPTVSWQTRALNAEQTLKNIMEHECRCASKCSCAAFLAAVADVALTNQDRK